MVNNKIFAQRLDKILNEYELSAANFADKIQVGRATISHILSGRNKPSLDFVLKITHAFPEVDLYWLLEGKGSFPKVEESTSSTLNNISTKVDSPEQNVSTTIENTYKQISQKKIKRIILCMEDGTFENYEIG